MAGKQLITPEVQKRMLQLKKKGNMTNVAIANKVTEEFGLERVPSAPTVSKIFSKAKTTSKKAQPKQLSAGEQLLHEAQKNPSTIQPNPRVIPNEIRESMLEESLNKTVDLSQFENFGSSNLGALNQLVNGSLESGASSFDDLLSSVPTTNEIESFDDYSVDSPTTYNKPLTRNGGNDDVTFRNKNNYSQTMIDDMYEDTNVLQKQNIATLNNGKGITISNESRLFLETLLNGQIYACGLILGGNIYFPSFNFKYMYEIRNGAQVNEGYVVVMQNAIHIVDETYITEKMEERISKALIGTSNWMKSNFKFNPNTKPTVMNYSMLIDNIGNDTSSIPFVNVINTLNQNKQLNNILKFPKLSDNGAVEFNLIVGLTSHNVSVLSFIQ